MRFDRKILCLTDYGAVNEKTELIAGQIYDAGKKFDGSWVIQGEGRNISFSKPVFLEMVKYLGVSDVTDGITLLDAVKFAYKQGYFSIADDNGEKDVCDGIHCRVKAGTEEETGFYCFGPNTIAHYGDAKTFERTMGLEAICEDITKQLEEMIQDQTFAMEAESYLEDIMYGYHRPGYPMVLEDVLCEAINRANHTLEGELEV